MVQADFDVIGIGNAIVDVLSHSSDAFITENGLTKGGMALIDATQADRLYEKMGPGWNVPVGLRPIQLPVWPAWGQKAPLSVKSKMMA